MPVKEADPAALDLDEAFRQAMDGPARPREAATPAEFDPEAPHGRGEDGEPLAPYGWTKPQRKGEQPRPKLLPGGRPRKDDDARLTDQAILVTDAKPSKHAKPDQDADYSQALAELHDAVWVGLTGLARIGPKIPVIGSRLPGQKIAAEAYVWHFNQARLCGAVALAAKHNEGAARFCAKLAKGEATWVLMAGAMIMPVFVQTAAVLGGDERLTEMDMPKLAELAQRNQAEMEQAMAQMMAKLGDAAETETAEAAA